MKEIEELIHQLFSCQTSTKEMVEWKEEITQYVTDSVNQLKNSGLSESEACYIAKKRLMDTDVVNEFQTYQQNMLNECMHTSSLSNLVLVGCSTGGPKALEHFFSQLPKNLPVAIVVVQHMPEGDYIRKLADFMNTKTSFTVKKATDGEEIRDGYVYMAPSGFHAEIIKRNNHYYLSLHKNENVSHHRPSFDGLLSSLSHIQNPIPLYVAVLTGMGRDGLLGLQDLKNHHPQTVVFAEHEDSAVIYGMPKQIITHQLADFIANLSTIIRLLCFSIQGDKLNNSPLSVLIVSDGLVYRAMVRKYIEKFYPNVSIQSVTTREKALLLEQEKRIDLVITNFTDVKDIRTPIFYASYQSQEELKLMEMKLNLLCA